jgi:hypothetical protein
MADHMADYLIIYVDGADDLARSEIIECPDDKAAMEDVISRLNGRLAELWNGDRLVIRLAPPRDSLRPV